MTSTFGVQNDPLFRTGTYHSSLDGVHVIQTSTRRNGNLGEFNGRS
jgi:hypothetical protein